VTGNAARQRLLIPVSHVLSYCMKRNICKRSAILGLWP